MKISNHAFALFLLVVLFFSCGKSEESCELDLEILGTEIDFSLERLEEKFFASQTPEDFFYLMEKYPEFTNTYLQKDLYLNEDSLVADLIQIHQDSTMKDLFQAVKTEFPDLDSVETDLRNAFKYIKYYYPEFKVPKVYTFVSGFNSDLLINEDMIVIGLDYFLPATHKYQPELPKYLAERYNKNHLVPMIITALSSRFNTINSEDNTLLAEMIYYGKAYHFTKAILPCTPEKWIIGYSEGELVDSYSNEEFIWSHFIENELLYETNPFEIRKYLGEAPFTDAISTKAPGRLGRWLGWNIVDDYQISENVSLVDLMSEADAAKIFKLSGYRPRGLE